MQESRSRKSKPKLAGTSIEDPNFAFKEERPESVCASASKSHNPKRNSSGGYDASSQPGHESSWLEQIQFKAQYNHYRTSSYASVVNSSCSLDKVENLRSERLRTRLESTGAGTERERHTLCWNFPRVKLPHIFNTKSLEDILGRNKSSDLRVKIKHKTNRKICGPATASNSSLSSESAGVVSPPILSKIQYQCEITPPSPKINLSSSSSDNYNHSGPSNVYLAVPRQGTGKKERTHSRSHSRSRVRVTTTKSDNCINRITTTTVPVSIMSSKISTKKVFAAPCGSNSADNLDVLESVHIPTSSSVPLNSSVTQKTNKKKIGFSTRVTPICSPDNEIAKMSLENRPKLVVASVSFLQRPVSPLPGLSQLPSPIEGCSGGDASSNNKISSHVFNNKLTNYGNDKTKCRDGCKKNGQTNADNSTKCDGRYMDSQINQRSNDSANLDLYKLSRPNPHRINFVNFQCCGLDSGDQNRALVSQPHSQVNTQGKCFQEQPRSIGEYPLSPVCTSNKGDNSVLDSSNRSRLEYNQIGQVDSHKKQAMGDLQSPQYVKRTAHMFNSRYPSAGSAQNGSAGTDETKKTTPSYLNVSRTISGYSCLSYGGSSTNTSNGHHGSNGTAAITGRTVPLAQPSHYGKSTTNSNGINSSHNNGSHSHLSETDIQSKYKYSQKSSYDLDRPNAPPLPKTPPPLYSPALTITERGAGHVREIPIVREKSPFILNRIERLCGSTEVMSSWKRNVPQSADSSRGRERNIPITLEDSNDQDIHVKGTSGKHNLMTNRPYVQSESSEGEDGKYASNSKDKQTIESEDVVDAESVWKVIPIHRNGNSKDFNNTASTASFEETRKSPELSNLKSGKTPDGGKYFAEGVDVESDFLPSTTLSKTATSTEEGIKKEPLPASMNKENEASSAEKNGDYFLLEMNKEKTRLDDRVAKASEQLDKLDTSSEEAGRIRAAIGKANLLCTKKFKQFRELCNTNLEQSRQGTTEESFTTKNDDLAGFWDMVLIQVQQLHSMFDELDPDCPVKPSPRLVASAAGQKLTPSRRSDPTKSSPSKRTPKSAASPLNKSTSESSAQRDESRRKLLLEKRKAMKNQQLDSGAQLEPDVQIFSPKTTN